MVGRIINNDISLHGKPLGTGDFFGISHFFLDQGVHWQLHMYVCMFGFVHVSVCDTYQVSCSHTHIPLSSTTMSNYPHTCIVCVHSLSQRAPSTNQAWVCMYMAETCTLYMRYLCTNHMHIYHFVHARRLPSCFYDSTRVDRHCRGTHVRFPWPVCVCMCGCVQGLQQCHACGCETRRAHKPREGTYLQHTCVCFHLCDCVQMKGPWWVVHCLPSLCMCMTDEVVLCDSPHLENMVLVPWRMRGHT